MRKSVVAGLAVVLALGIFIVFIRVNEPRYNGRTLTGWLQEYSDAPMMETQRVAEAKEAVLAIGARKALSIILKLAETQDDPVSTWTTAKTEEFRISFLHWHSTIDSQLMGIDGFEILGTNAAPAVPELTRLLDDKKRALVAVRCLANIEKPAEMALCQCLTNGNPNVRRFGLLGLASATDDVEVYIARIKGRLNDSEAYVRFAAVTAISEQQNAPELAVPLLITASQDNDESVASHAVLGLSDFGTNAASAFSTLTNIVNSGRKASAQAALKALPKIAPSEALMVLSNAIVNGSPEILGAALQNLKSLALPMALKMTLDEFRSPDPQRREKAIGAASNYDPSTPGVAAALKLAATDTNPQVAQHAAMVMRQMVQAQDESAGADVQFRNQPSYQGKSLGEWLKTRQYDQELSTNAVNAVREMGTNAIPALLARLTYKDPVFDLPRYEVSMSGVTGFIALGDQAVPALPSLAKVMDSNDQDLAIRAMMATLGTGTNALPCLVKGMTSRHLRLRNESFHTLADWSTQFPKGREMEVFLLRNLLTDPDPEIRINATNLLTEIGSKPTAKAELK